MREPDADWHMVAKRMMYDFRVFNSEICDLPSDNKNVYKNAAEETTDSDKKNASQTSFSAPESV